MSLKTIIKRSINTVKFAFASRSKRIELAYKLTCAIEDFNESKFFDIFEYVVSLLPYGTYAKKVIDVLKEIMPDLAEIFNIMNLSDNYATFSENYNAISAYLAKKKGSELSAEVMAMINNALMDKEGTKKDESKMTAIEAAKIYKSYKN